MKIVAHVPHILAGSRDEICLLLSVVGDGASCSTDVGVRAKDTERTLRAGARPFHVVCCPPCVARERAKFGEVGSSTRRPVLLIASRPAADLETEASGLVDCALQ